MTDKEKLRGMIKEKGIKLGYIGERLNISYPTLQKKLDGEVEFKGSEIIELGKILDIHSVSELESIFFNCNVENPSTL